MLSLPSNGMSESGNSETSAPTSRTTYFVALADCLYLYASESEFFAGALPKASLGLGLFWISYSSPKEATVSSSTAVAGATAGPGGGSTVLGAEEDGHCFTLRTPGRQVTFYSPHTREIRSWVDTLRALHSQ